MTANAATTVCVVTGSRAEYGLLQWVMHDIAAHPSLKLQVIATAMHLAPQFGLTLRQIEADGFHVDRCVDMLLAGDSRSSVSKSLGLGVIGMTEALQSLNPDMVLILGDRFEMLAVAQVCMLLQIPLAHIAGGDITEGAVDDAIRHAITKMAHVHFVTNTASAARVRQLGEDPQRIHVVGSPGLDQLRRSPLLNRAETASAIGAELGRRNALVTFHPVTLAHDDGMHQVNALLEALDAFIPELTVWVTLPNADASGQQMAARLRAWATAHGTERVHVFASLGSLRYLSLMSHCDLVVGNSSSGLYEAPSFDIPTVNVGERQQGRLAASSVLHCDATVPSIVAAVRKALTLKLSGTVNPYGDGHSAARIARILASLPARQVLLAKRFHLVETFQ